MKGGVYRMLTNETGFYTDKDFIAQPVSQFLILNSQFNQ